MNDKCVLLLIASNLLVTSTSILHYKSRCLLKAKNIVVREY